MIDIDEIISLVSFIEFKLLLIADFFLSRLVSSTWDWLISNLSKFNSFSKLLS